MPEQPQNASLLTASPTRFQPQNANSQKKEFTEWLEWTFFNTNIVEFIERYAAKGQYVRIEGKVQQSSYEKNGSTVYTNEVRGFRFDFCEPKAPGASQGGGYADDEFPY